MISREQALAIAYEWLNSGVAPQQRRQIGLHEFELGYVVWAVQPSIQGPPGQRRPPEDIGGACGVVDQRTGELTTWPSVPVEEVVRMYREKHGTESAPTNRPAVGPGNSVAVTYRDGRGEEIYLTRLSGPGLPHPAWQALHELQRLGIPPQNVLAIHSELRSCRLPGGYCGVLLETTFPQAEISYGQPYGDTRESRAAAIAAVADQAEMMAGLVGQAPPPRANPVPVPAKVQPAPPVDGPQLAQELGLVFGTGQVRTFRPDELAHTNLPSGARATLTYAGLPAAVPYFFRVAGQLRPVHEHLRVNYPRATERIVQKLSGTDSVAIGDDGHAVICIQCGGSETAKGRLWAVDPDGGWAQFVNTNVAAFARSLALLAGTWPRMHGLDPYAAGAVVADFQARLAAIDPRALDGEDQWWTVIIEQMWDGLL